MKITDKIEITNEDNMELMARYPDNYFDLAIVDPPYGIGVSKKTHHQPNTKNKITVYQEKKWDNETPTESYWNELFRVSKNQIVWGGNYFTDYLKPTKDWIVWDKNQPQDMHFAMGELAWCSFGRGLRIFYRSIAKDQNRVSNNKEKAQAYKRIHPTQKPRQLYNWLLDNYAKEGDKILDTHLGSGSIALACHERGFELTACELDKDYYEASIKRIKNHIAQQRLF